MRWLWAWIIRMFYTLTKPIVRENSDTTSDLTSDLSFKNTEYHYYVTQQEDDDDAIGLDIDV